jgi:c-di-GMP-binding flagellar brake protein YcgR
VEVDRSGAPDLRVDVGDVLHLQSADSERPARFAVRIIGYLTGKSLLVTAPATQAGLVLLREGQPFTVRVLVDNRVWGFATRVLKSNARPYPYVHLAYPRELESVVVRKSPRASTDLIVSVRRAGEDEPLTARMLDISINGTRVWSADSLGAVGDLLDLAVRLTIGELEEYLRLPARIRREQSDPGVGGAGPPGHLYGLEFEAPPAHARLALYAYVYGRLAG